MESCPRRSWVRVRSSCLFYGVECYCVVVREMAMRKSSLAPFIGRWLAVLLALHHQRRRILRDIMLSGLTEYDRKESVTLRRRDYESRDTVRDTIDDMTRTLNVTLIEYHSSLNTMCHVNVSQAILVHLCSSLRHILPTPNSTPSQLHASTPATYIISRHTLQDSYDT